MDVFSSVGVCVFFLFFLRWCILHCCTNALEKTALSHALLQNCLCAKQLPATVSKLVQFNLNTEKYEYHMIFSILKTHITTLVDCSLIAFKNCSSPHCSLILPHPAWGAFPWRSAYPGHISPTFALSSKLRIQATSTTHACADTEHCQNVQPAIPVFKKGFVKSLEILFICALDFYLSSLDKSVKQPQPWETETL